MSWFKYGTPKRRSLRKGVWLKVINLPKNILDKANNLIDENENIEWVVIEEIRPKGKVFLEFWCRKLGSMKPNQPVVYKVFAFEEDEDPNWICEGDLGRGCK